MVATPIITSSAPSIAWRVLLDPDTPAVDDDVIAAPVLNSPLPLSRCSLSRQIPQSSRTLPLSDTPISSPARDFSNPDGSAVFGRRHTATNGLSLCWHPRGSFPGFDRFWQSTCLKLDKFHLPVNLTHSPRTWQILPLFSPLSTIPRSCHPHPRIPDTFQVSLFLLFWYLREASCSLSQTPSNWSLKSSKEPSTLTASSTPVTYSPNYSVPTSSLSLIS